MPKLNQKMALFIHQYRCAKETCNDATILEAASRLSELLLDNREFITASVKVLEELREAYRVPLRVQE